MTVLTGEEAVELLEHRRSVQRRGGATALRRPDDVDRASGGRPVIYDADLYKRSNTVERSFNRMKHYRGWRSRYDKLALVYRGGVVLASILTWSSRRETRLRGRTAGVVMEATDLNLASVDVHSGVTAVRLEIAY